MSTNEHPPRLLLTDADGTHTYPLLHFPLASGRSGESDLCMAHAQVSRQHAAIESEPDGSTCATWAAAMARCVR